MEDDTTALILIKKFDDIEMHITTQITAAESITLI